MEFIEINTATPELKDQLSFLIKREFYVTYYKYKKLPYYLLGFTVLLVGLLLFTNQDDFIVPKVMLLIFIAIGWVVSMIFLFTILIKLYNRNIWMKKAIKEIFKNNTKFQLAFNDEGISFITDTWNSNTKWETYKYYAEYKNSIFIIPANDLYASSFHSKNDLGIDNYERLKAIVSSKLIPISTK